MTHPQTIGLYLTIRNTKLKNMITRIIIHFHKHNNNPGLSHICGFWAPLFLLVGLRWSLLKTIPFTDWDVLSLCGFLQTKACVYQSDTYMGLFDVRLAKSRCWSPCSYYKNLNSDHFWASWLDNAIALLLQNYKYRKSATTKICHK